MKQPVKRIVLIGCPGTGKSTLAIKLAEQTKLPVLHLDKDWHAKNRWSNDVDQKCKQWRKHIAELLKEPAWIMDGNYTSTLDLRIPAADLVIFLDYPTTTALNGVLKRRMMYRGTHTRTDMPEGWREQFNLQLIKKVFEFKRSHKPRILALLAEQPQNRVVIVKNRSTLNQQLAQLKL